VISATDYYPFGMVARTYTSPEEYRYGFNGQERETELDESTTSAEYWMYDGRLGRRWNVDPKYKKYTSLSTFSTFGNSPILFSDLNGDDWYKSESGKIQYVEYSTDPSVTLSDGNTYTRIGPYLTDEVINEVIGREFSLFKSATSWEKFNKASSFDALGKIEKVPGSWPGRLYHMNPNEKGDRVVRMEQILVANGSITYQNFADVIMGAMISGDGPENFYFGPDHPLSQYVGTTDIVRDAVAAFYKQNEKSPKGKFTTYKGHHSLGKMAAIASVVESALLQEQAITPEQLIGGAWVEVSPIYDENQEITGLSVKVFNVTSTGSGSTSSNSQSFVRPEGTNATTGPQPYTNVSQTFEIVIDK
jgi:hypothetical protein